jgi:signal transduction histidine kinase
MESAIKLRSRRLAERQDGPGRDAGRLPLGWLSRAGTSALLWTALGTVFAAPALAGDRWQQPLLGSLTQWWAWGLLAPVIIAADKRLPIPSSQIWVRALAHVPLSLLFTSVCVYVAGFIRAAIGLTSWQSVFSLQPLQMSLQGFFYWSWLIYWLIAGAWLARDYHSRFRSSELRAERMERLFSEARLNALRLQLDPHFLFNTLHTISAHVEADPRLARQMIEHLGNLLRSSIETKDRQLITLAEEMQVLEHYLEIQRIRFGRRLTLETSIADSARFALVPCLMIQPLVENAIRHGISARREGGTVMVSAWRDDGLLRIAIEDDGVGLPPDWEPGASGGLGLSVTRQRIAGLHPDGTASFELVPRAGGGTKAAIALPFRLETGQVA